MGIRQLQYRWLEQTSHICIEQFIKIVDSIKLYCAYFLKDNNILEDNQRDRILFNSLSKLYLTTSPLSMPLAALLDLIIIANTNRLVCKVCIVRKQP